jgi:hypothetical protein
MNETSTTPSSITDLPIEDLLKLVGEYGHFPHEELIKQRREEALRRGGEIDHLRDPIESDPALALQFAKVDAIINELARRIGPSFGYSYFFNNLRRMLLLEGYGIEWITPRDMNPGYFAFDNM